MGAWQILCDTLLSQDHQGRLSKRKSSQRDRTTKDMKIWVGNLTQNKKMALVGVLSENNSNKKLQSLVSISLKL